MQMEPLMAQYAQHMLHSTLRVTVFCRLLKNIVVFAILFVVNAIKKPAC